MQAIRTKKRNDQEGLVANFSPDHFPLPFSPFGALSVCCANSNVFCVRLIIANALVFKLPLFRALLPLVRGMACVPGCILISLTQTVCSMHQQEGR